MCEQPPVARQCWHSVFDQVYDVAITGSGYAGLAAALALRAAGKRVLLLDVRGDLVWESGRAFVPEPGESASPGWACWQALLKRCDGLRHGVLDGAVAEIEATQLLLAKAVDVLYCAAPVAVEADAGLLAGVVLATKGGLRRVAARRWIDASEEAALVRLLDPTLQLPRPVAVRQYLYFEFDEQPLQGPDLRPGLRATQRILALEDAGSAGTPGEALLAALRAAHQADPRAMAEALLTHGSVEPYPVYAAGGKVTAPAANVALAVPAWAGTEIVTLADRYALGERAAASLADLPGVSPAADLLRHPVVQPLPRETWRAEVAVAGAGTGGALAAIAAARGGAETLCFDPLPFPGGQGTAGILPWYCFGVPGGMQREVDERVHALRPLFGGRRVVGYHTLAKRLVLEAMFREACVRFVPGAQLYSVDSRDRRVVAGRVALAGGTAQVEAGAWIDATGDGDLCALAGQPFALGRWGDGLSQAYSQVIGTVQRTQEGGRTLTRNRIEYWDSGWVDATDSEDLTRARLAGIVHWRQERYDDVERPTNIGPALGLRQSRHIVTDYALALADVIERRRFPDCIGLTGGFADKHEVDREFEGDELLFWDWACGAVRERTACEIPYRLLLPRGLDNVWLACRAVGCTIDGHASFRMLRDIQRIGEVAGWAAALSRAHGCAARAVPFAQLRERLAATGEIDLAEADVEPPFGGRVVKSAAFRPWDWQEEIAAGLAALERGEASPRLWALYQAPHVVRERVVAALQSEDESVSWAAAAVSAMWGTPAAELRLLRAIERREWGIGATGEVQHADGLVRLAPRWLVALSLLRRCGSDRCLPALAALGRDSGLILNVRTAVALTLERLVAEGMVTGRAQALSILNDLTAGPIPLACAPATRHFGQLLRPGADRGTPGPRKCGVQGPAEDHCWQLDLVAARLRRDCGLDIRQIVQDHNTDPRAYVRSAFAALAKPY